jgi:hypothetical protein
MFCFYIVILLLLCLIYMVTEYLHLLFRLCFISCFYFLLFCFVFCFKFCFVLCYSAFIIFINFTCMFGL